MRSIVRVMAGLAVAASLSLVLGCPPAPTKSNPATKGGDDDEHVEGPHKGVVVEWGNEEYHVEFTVDHKAQEAKVYIYGPDHAKLKPAPIKADKVVLNIKGLAKPVELKPEKQAGEPEGTASVFAGKHEKLGEDKPVTGTLSAEVNGKQYNSDLKGDDGHGHKH